jgi:hypothetical protein
MSANIKNIEISQINNLMLHQSPGKKRYAVYTRMNIELGAGGLCL